MGKKRIPLGILALGVLAAYALTPGDRDVSLRIAGSTGATGTPSPFPPTGTIPLAGRGPDGPFPWNRADQHLAEVMDKYHLSFDVYTDGGTGGNHFVLPAKTGTDVAINASLRWETRGGPVSWPMPSSTLSSTTASTATAGSGTPTRLAT